MAVNKVIYGASTIIDLTDATATSDKIISGYTAYGADGQKMTGTANIVGSGTIYQDETGHIVISEESGDEIILQNKSVTPTESAQTITADSGYGGLHLVSVGAISNTYVGSSIPTNQTPTVSAHTVTIPSGYYSSAATASVATATQATPSVSINTSTGLVTATASQSAGYVTAGTKSGTLQLTTKAASTITPTESQQTAVAANTYTTGAVKVAAISSTYVGSGVATKSSANLTASGATVTAPAGYYSAAATKTIDSGSATTPATTITTTPTITINDSGKITAANNATSSITPTIVSGYVSAGTAGTVTAAGTSTYQMSTQAAKTITPTEAVQRAVSSHYYTTGHVSVAAISSTYVGSGVPTKSAANLTASGSVVTVPSGYYSSAVTKAVGGGTATTPATTITTQPTITVGSDGLITATNSGTSSITPTVVSGYISSGTAGTVTVSGTKTSQLSTKAASTITPTTSQQVAVPSGYYTTGAVNVAAIPSQYIVPTGTSTITSNGTFDVGQYASASVSVVPNLTSKTVNPSSEVQVVEPYDWLCNVRNTITASSRSIGQQDNAQVDFSPVTSLTQNEEYLLRGKINITDSNGNILEYYDVNTTFIFGSSFQTIVTNDSNAYISKIRVNERTTGGLQFAINVQKAATFGYEFDLKVYTADYDALEAVTVNPVSLIDKTVTPSGKKQLVGPGDTICVFSGTISGTTSRSSGNTNSLQLSKDRVTVEWTDGNTYRIVGQVDVIDSSSNVIETYNVDTTFVLSTVAQTIISNDADAYFSQFQIYQSSIGGTYLVLKYFCQKTATYGFKANFTVFDISEYAGLNIVTVNPVPSDYWSQTAVNSFIQGQFSGTSGYYENSNVSYIGSGAFFTKPIQSVYFPNVTSIYDYAFASCASLTTVSFPLCSYIWPSAFYRCIHLESAMFSLVKTVSQYAFQGCSNLTTVSLPICSQIGYGAFSSCSVLNSVYAPSCKTIGGSCFGGCSSLATISLPQCQSIGDYAFISCRSLSSIYVPECLSINQYAFYKCSALSQISLPKCTTLGGYAFSDCGLTTISLPLCTSITGGSAFGNCKSLSQAYLSILSSLQFSTFAGCNALTDVSLPNCQIISGYAFQSCTALSHISLPSLTSLSNYAFNGCTSLMSVYLNVSSVPYMANAYPFNGTPISNSTYTGAFGSIFVPSSLYDAFKTATGWKSYSARIVSYNFT